MQRTATPLTSVRFRSQPPESNEDTLEDYYKEFISIMPEEIGYDFYLGSNFSEINPKEYEAIFIRIGLDFHKNNLSQFLNLKYVVSPTTAVTNVDIDYLIEHNINLISLRGSQKYSMKYQQR